MATCGKCHTPGVNVAHVRACYGMAAGQASSQSNLDQRVQAERQRVNTILRGDRPAPARRMGTNQPGGMNAIPDLDPHDAAYLPLVPTQRPAAVSRDWEKVNNLRNEIKAHLHRETKQGGHQRVGYFAIKVDDAGGLATETIKFLRIKEMLSGKWAGKVFVDSQASDDYHSVKAPRTLELYLAAVLLDPEAAGRLYADELGSCCRCGRTLTHEESRAQGIGPECAKWA